MPSKDKFFVYSLGIFACLDGSMNVILEQVEEFVNGEVIDKYE